MTVQEIHDMWKVDGEINGNELDRESNRIPQLHGKYLNFLSDERMTLKKMSYKLKQIELEKDEYYSGRMSTDKMTAKGLRPFPHKIMKSDIDKYIQADKEVIEFKLRMAEKQECVNVLESIIDQINKRTFVIGNAIKFLQFTNGIV